MPWNWKTWCSYQLVASLIKEIVSNSKYCITNCSQYLFPQGKSGEFNEIAKGMIILRSGNPIPISRPTITTSSLNRIPLS